MSLYILAKRRRNALTASSFFWGKEIPTMHQVICYWKARMQYVLFDIVIESVFALTALPRKLTFLSLVNIHTETRRPSYLPLFSVSILFHIHSCIIQLTLFLLVMRTHLIRLRLISRMYTFVMGRGSEGDLQCCEHTDLLSVCQILNHETIFTLEMVKGKNEWMNFFIIVHKDRHATSTRWIVLILFFQHLLSIVTHHLTLTCR